MGRKASTPLGPAAGPHTQLAQNIVLSWLTGARSIELKTVQLFDNRDTPRPSIDTENVGYSIEWSQDLKLEDSLREYIKAWMLIEMLKHSDFFGEEFCRHHCHAVFNLSIGYTFKDIKSERMYNYIENLKDAQPIIDMLRDEIPQKFSAFKEIDYDPHLIRDITLSTSNDCTVEELDNIVSHLFMTHQVDVTIKLNPTLLGEHAVTHLLKDVLGYEEIEVSPETFKQNLTFAKTMGIIRAMHDVAKRMGRTLGLKCVNPLLVQNHKGYLNDAVMTLSGPPLHVFGLHVLKKVSDALGDDLQRRIPMSFSAGVDDYNVADIVSLNLSPVTICTDLLKAPGYPKLAAYLNTLGEQMQTVDAINVPDYVMKRFGHEVEAVRDVFAQLRKEADYLCGKLPEEQREQAMQEQLQTFDGLEERLLQAMKENSDSLELLTTDALIVTETLTQVFRKFGENVLMPQTFKDLYVCILSNAARRNLDTLLERTMQDARYTAAHNSKVVEKQDSELGLYDCVNCGVCVTLCPNNANFVYHVSPVKINYVNYELTPDEIKEGEGGQFVIGKALQIANFDDCCNECGVCAIHCPERGTPFLDKPKYFGSRERWETHRECDGFWVEKDGSLHTITGRIGGREYTLKHDTTSIQVVFSDGVIEATFEYPDTTLLSTTVLEPGQFGHILDMRIYHVLLTQLEGVLNDTDCNYINIRYL